MFQSVTSSTRVIPTNRERVLKCIMELGGIFTIKEVHERTGISEKVISNICSQLYRENKLLRYTLKDVLSGRISENVPESIVKLMVRKAKELERKGESPRSMIYVYLPKVIAALTPPLVPKTREEAAEQPPSPMGVMLSFPHREVEPLTIRSSIMPLTGEEVKSQMGVTERIPLEVRPIHVIEYVGVNNTFRLRIEIPLNLSSREVAYVRKALEKILREEIQQLFEQLKILENYLRGTGR